MDIEKAARWVRSNGGEVGNARLETILNGSPPPPLVVEELFAAQREDGGFAPFYAPESSGLDATCYRLAQAEQVGVEPEQPAFWRAVEFIAARQDEDGHWEESPELQTAAPPWLKPGDLASRLYLTSNCGCWLAFAGKTEGALRASLFLAGHLPDDGRLPGFLHTSWLAAGLWQRLGQTDLAARALQFLETRLPDLEAGALAWMVNTLVSSGAGDTALVHTAARRLGDLQQPDGSWRSEDGENYDLHATLEAIRAIRRTSK